MAFVPHVVRQGEYLEKIARTLAFDAEAVWNDPANRALRDRRKNPEVLCPGDVLMVPEPTPRKPLSLAVGAHNAFKAKVPTVKVTVLVKNGGEPLANEPCVIEGLGPRIAAQSDGEGQVEIEAPLHVREVRLIFYKRALAVPVRIGDLDPVEEPSGVRQRLEHLGYYGLLLGPATRAARTPEPAADAEALRDFQRAHSLPETGVADEATRAALVAAHGG